MRRENNLRLAPRLGFKSLQLLNRSFPEGAFKLPVGSVADGVSFWRSTISLGTMLRKPCKK